MRCPSALDLWRQARDRGERLPNVYHEPCPRCGVRLPDIGQSYVELGMKLRTARPLAHHGWHSVAAIAQATDRELLDTPNFGSVALAEVRLIIPHDVDGQMTSWQLIRALMEPVDDGPLIGWCDA